MNIRRGSGAWLMLRKIHYISGAYLPSKEASAVHIAQMCEAFAALGLETTLYGKHGEPESIVSYYGLQHTFRVCKQNPLTHQLWLLRRQLSMDRAAPSTVWFGRRHSALARLGAAGYPVALELHQPPHRRNQLEAVHQIVRAPRFLGFVVISKCLKEEMRARLPKLAPERFLVAHDGVRADRFCEPTIRTRAPLRAVYCGSFHRGKGVDTLLRAAARVPEIAIDILGGTPEQISSLRPMSPRNVRFLGHLPYDEAQRRLPEYDVALAPYGTMVRGARGSRRKNNLAPWMSPLKLFEYAAAGVPIVTTDLPVLREILSPGIDALMTAPDDVDAVAGAIKRIVRDGELRLRLARAAQSRLREYTWHQRAAAVTDFLERMLSLNDAREHRSTRTHAQSSIRTDL